MELLSPIEVAFASNEMDYIHNSGVNVGFTQTFLKVNRCYFLTAGAKQLYTNIISYAWGGKKECFPCQETLKMELDWSNTTLNTYTNELRDKNLIQTERRVGTSMKYIITELHKIPLIAHSELIHVIREAHFKHEKSSFGKALKKYKDSELYQSVLDHYDPSFFKERIEQFFSSTIFSLVPSEEPIEKTGSSPLPKKLPTTFAKDPEIKTEADPDRSPKKKVDKDFNAMEINSWKSPQFLGLFEEEYLKKYKLPYARSAGDLGALKRLIDKRNDNHALAEHVKTYFSLEFFDSKPRSVLNFSSGFVQSNLTHYLNFGTLSSYKSNSGNQDHVTKLGGDEDWLRDNGYLR